ncbi:MAG: hypothetical protein WC552_08405 [Candidatus Omnitrophota bacterium]
MAKKDSNLDDPIKCVIEVVKAAFEGKSQAEIAEKPVIEKKNLMEYEGKMRVVGMDAFNEPTYIVTVSFYLSAKAQASHLSCGAFVFYLKQAGAEDLLKSLGYREAEEENEPSMLKGCGEFCKTLVQKFIASLREKGYVELLASPPEAYRNSVPFGIDFSLDQFELGRTIFSLKGSKTMVVDITMGFIPRSK